MISEWFLLFDEAIAWYNFLRLHYYSLVLLVLEGCSKGINATWMTIFQIKLYLSLGNPQFAITAEYFHIVASRSQSCLGKMGLLCHHLI
jgi:hypothetical protein